MAAGFDTSGRTLDAMDIDRGNRHYGYHSEILLLIADVLLFLLVAHAYFDWH